MQALFMPMRIYSEEKCGNLCSHISPICVQLGTPTHSKITHPFRSPSRSCLYRSVSARRSTPCRCALPSATQPKRYFPSQKCQLPNYSRYFLTSTQLSSAIVENEGSLSRSLFKLAQTASMGAPAAVTPQTENVRALTMHGLNTWSC
jgi:hypothetical protein